MCINLLLNSFFFISGQDLYLIIHNIDGTMLRNEKTQNILSLLSLIPNIHLIASVDHINSSLSKYERLICLVYRFLDVHYYTPDYGISGWYTQVNRRSVGWLVCWWNVVSLTRITPPTVFKSCKWNLLHMIPLICRYAWHHLCKAWPNGNRVLPLFSKFKLF